MTSGGVRKAAMTKIAKIIYFLKLISCSTDTTPILHNTKITTGNSKTIPKAITKPNRKPTYWLIDNIGVAKFSPMNTKNVIADKKTILYPNAIHTINKITEPIENIITAFFSFSYSAGLTKSHIFQKITGADTTMAAINETFSWATNASDKPKYIN